MRPGLVCLLLLPARLSSAAPHPAEQPLVKLPVIRSEDYRQDQRYQITAGTTVVPYWGATLQGAYFSTPDTLYTLAYSQGFDVQDALMNLFSSEGWTTMRMVNVGVKRFLENSLYIEGTGFFRRLEHTASSRENGEIRFERESLGVTLALGQQWQWATFTLGCDWIGGIQPLVQSALKTRFDSDTDPNAFTDDRAEFERSAEGSRLMLLRFYLGYSF